MGSLETSRLAVGALNVVELAPVIERPGGSPDTPNDVEIFVGAPIARVVVQPVAILSLFHIAAPGDYVQRDAATRELIQSGGLASGQSGRYESGTVSYQIAQTFGMRRGVTRHLEPVRRRGGVAGENHVESRVLMNTGEIQDIFRINT